MACVYQKLLHVEISKKHSKIKECSFFPNFVVKLKAFELNYDYLIHYFPIVFPVSKICKNFNLLAWNISKVIYHLKKIEKISFRLQNFKIFEIFDLKGTSTDI